MNEQMNKGKGEDQNTCFYDMRVGSSLRRGWKTTDILRSPRKMVSVLRNKWTSEELYVVYFLKIDLYFKLIGQDQCSDLIWAVY